MRKILRNVLGATLFILGIPGLVLPILQGWLFLGLGALLLSIDIPFFDKIVRWIEDKIPRLKQPIERVRHFLKGQQ
jgi:uncharacterized protein